MNKRDLAREVSKRVSSKYTIDSMEMIIENIIEVIKDTVKSNEKIDFRGFLKIEQKFYKAEEGVIGEHKWSKPERYVPKITLSRIFKSECGYEK